MVLHLFLSFLSIFVTSQSIVLTYSGVFCVFPSFLAPKTGTLWSSGTTGRKFASASISSGTSVRELASASWYLVTSWWALLSTYRYSVTALDSSGSTSASTASSLYWLGTVSASMASSIVPIFSEGWNFFLHSDLQEHHRLLQEVHQLQKVLHSIDQKRQKLLQLHPLFQNLQKLF